ncbi:MAG: LON peptidase substrate-binding domain-containing protein [Candidatus Sumerlaeia bacterium]|nr:LON peptidase substrate-binding domain-containing protein [Candidatus Sumerlaeia bacterium]
MDTLPLFPLPNFVLFPRCHAPLHIFEPRYREMMEEVMAGPKKLVLAQLRPGYEADYYGAPRIHRVATVARVLWSERTDDGRYNLLAEGAERIEVLEDRPNGDSFRRVCFAPLLDELVAGGEERDVAIATAECVRLAETIGLAIAPKNRSLQNMLNTHLHPGIIADVAAQVLVLDPYARQSILEATSILRRLRLVNVQLAVLLARINAGDIELPVADA